MPSDAIRVYLAADSGPELSRLRGVFASRLEFVIVGQEVVFGVPLKAAVVADVIVARVANRALLSGLVFPAPLLVIADAAPGSAPDSYHPQLSLSSSPLQVRAAAMALAAGLLIREGQRSALLPDEVMVESLTERESEVLNLMAEGYSNKEIARRLGVSRNTIKFHVSSIMGKLGVTSRTEAVTVGFRRGLILI